MRQPVPGEGILALGQWAPQRHGPGDLLYAGREGFDDDRPGIAGFAEGFGDLRPGQMVLARCAAVAGTGVKATM